MVYLMFEVNIQMSSFGKDVTSVILLLHTVLTVWLEQEMMLAEMTGTLLKKESCITIYRTTRLKCLNQLSFCLENNKSNVNKSELGWYLLIYVYVLYIVFKNMIIKPNFNWDFWHDVMFIGRCHVSVLHCLKPGFHMVFLGRRGSNNFGNGCERSSKTKWKHNDPERLSLWELLR